MPNNIPKILYGTAWKEQDTESLTLKAINLGFRGIDTANQRVHYYEQAVGKAIKKALDSELNRKDLFIQTKFTYSDGQDHRLPYDINADLKTQVKQSFQSSLNHLNTDFIDSYILHGPSNNYTLTEKDFNVWNEMEYLFKDNKVRYLGISNVNLNQLQELYLNSEIKPSFVQNRCFAHSQWDKNIRQFCEKHNINYQGFSLLTANQDIFSNKEISKMSFKYSKTPAQIIFRFAIQIGMIPITGTRDETHIKQDLDINNFLLSDQEIDYIENFTNNNL